MILFLKELWALRFWLLFIAVLVLLDLLSDVWTDFIDLKPFTATGHQRDDTEDYIILNLIIGLGTAATALGHERDYDTQRFLDGLPVSRSRVYAMKCLAAYLVTMLYPVANLSLEMALGIISLKSTSEPLPWVYAMQFTLLTWVQGFALTGVGMLLGFSRRWFAALAGLLIWLAFWLRLQEGWWASLLDSAELLKPNLENESVHSISMIALSGHLGVGLLGFASAWMLYIMREGSISALLTRFWQKRSLRWLVKVSPLTAIIVWVLVIRDVASTRGEKDDDDDTAPVSVAAGEKPADKTLAASVTQFEKRETRYCEFIFKSSQTLLAEPLIAAADRACNEALAAFGKEGLWPGKLVVDLSSQVVSHAAAQTNWTKIRFPLRPDMTKDERVNILRHELTHVIIEQLSDGQASQHFESMRAFHEGMATWVESSSFDSAAKAERRHHEIMAALAWSRGEVPLSTLLNVDTFTEERDEFLVYPLGMILAEALITTGGKEMPRLVLQTLNLQRPPAGLKGKNLWQHLLNHTGHSMAKLDAAYEMRMASLVKQHQTLINQLPRLSAEVKVNAENIVIHPDKASQPKGWQMICATEPRFGLLRQRTKLKMEPDGTFQLKRSSHTDTRLRYMLGWYQPKEKIIVFEHWKETALPRTEP